MQQDVPPGALPPQHRTAAGITEVTLGELIRNVQALQMEIRELRTTLNNLPAEVRIANTRMDSLDGRLEDLEANQTWLVRLVLGVIVTAVVGVALVTGG